MSAGQLIVLLGAPGTGKTTTARELTRILCARGMDAAAVPSASLIDEACAAHRLVLAELDGDVPVNACQQAGAIMLMSLDLGWTKQLGCTEASAGEQADSQIRQTLQQAGLAYAVVAGHGIARIEHALSLIDHLLDEPARQQRMRAQGSSAKARWRWFCDNCDDGECEQHWLPRAGR